MDFRNIGFAAKTRRRECPTLLVDVISLGVPGGTQLENTNVLRAQRRLCWRIVLFCRSPRAVLTCGSSMVVWRARRLLFSGDWRYIRPPPSRKTWCTTWPDRSRRCVWRSIPLVAVGYPAHWLWRLADRPYFGRLKSCYGLF